MALQDLTGNFRGKKFEGGVGGGVSPVTYGGPEPLDENVSPETLKASVMGIYEKYGRSAKGIRMAKASPEYAALQGAGISVFGTPTAKVGSDGKLTGGTTSLENAPDGAKGKAASQYAALSGTGGRGRTSRTGSSTLTDSVNGGAEVAPPAPTQNKPRIPESTAQTAQSTSMNAVNPPAPAPEAPKVEPTTKPNVTETTKGPRLYTSSRDYNANKPESEMQKLDGSQGANNEAMSQNMASRDKINKQSLRGGASGITAGDAYEQGFGNQPSDPSKMLDNSDAGAKMMRAKARNDLQDEREGMKKEYNSQAVAAGRTDDFNKKLAGYQTEKGDAQTAMQTGEVVDRSQFGGTKVSGRETYKGPGGKEFVGNRTSEGFIGLPSKKQNEADTYNKGMIEVSDESRRNQDGTDVATANKYNISSKDPNSAYLGQGSKENFNAGAGDMEATKDNLPSQYQKERLGVDVKKFTTGTATPREGTDLTEAELKKKKSQSFAGPTPKA